ncbi:MAG: hypothetical protein M1438_19020 [Deltaproteobacteria bacterium]|nr:hypothetical protein [Deltaproteobacteria bacterium]
MIVMIRIVLGVILLFIGISGLILPIIPGILFIFLGILVLSIDLPVIGKLLNKIEQQYPGVGKKLKELRAILGARGDDQGAKSP